MRPQLPKNWLMLPVALCLLAALYSTAQTILDPTTKRLAIVIGANNGGPERALLKYAESDARVFAHVLKTLGGINREDIFLVTGPDIQTIENTFGSVEKRLSQVKTRHRRIEVILYYSGHADEKGILIGQNQILYKEFKNRMEKLPADIRIAVIDACASGAFTRLKGGQKKPAFLMDESVDMQGYAVLTSNSEDEPAQESDRIRGSYFTHSLVSGMRGAADISQDGKVTLNEAYQYAFQETLNKTENTQAGPQHAGYDIQLSGSGEFVMTDLRTTAAVLSLEKDMSGRVYIKDEKDNLVVELKKIPDRQIDIGLDKGKYKVSLEKEGPFLVTQVDLFTNKNWLLRESQFTPGKRVATVLRGGTHIQPYPVYDTIPVSFALFPPYTKKDGKYQFQSTYHKYSINLLLGGYAKLDGIGVGLLGQWGYDYVKGAQFAGIFNVADTLNGGQAAGLFNVAGEVRGGQGSGYFNVSRTLRGGQGAGFFNVARDVYGGQGSGFFNVAMNLEGGQGCGFFNVALDVKGGQGSGFFNIARDMQGGQGSGFFNIARNVKGVQGAGFINGAWDVRGVQIAGFVNAARDVKGAQVGFLNVARTVEGETFGILNLSKSTKFHPVVWMDEAGLTQITLKTGAGYFYGMLSAGARGHDLSNIDRQYVYGVGLGAKKVFGPLILMGDASENTVFQEIDSEWKWGYHFNRLRLGTGVQFASHLSLVVGPTFNLAHYSNAIPEYQDYIKTYTLSKSLKLHFWPGFFAGVEF